jgi:hypothetical protein
MVKEVKGSIIPNDNDLHSYLVKMNICDLHDYIVELDLLL